MSAELVRSEYYPRVPFCFVSNRSAVGTPLIISAAGRRIAIALAYLDRPEVKKWMMERAGPGVLAPSTDELNGCHLWLFNGL